jgi:hypothetical protein
MNSSLNLSSDKTVHKTIDNNNININNIENINNIDNIDNIDTFDIIDIIDSVDTVNTVDSIDTVDKTLNLSEYLDYNDMIYRSLPQNARKYYISSNKVELSNIVSKFSIIEQTTRRLNMLRLYPFIFCKYASDNELVLMLINGKYKIYKGPGWFTKVGFIDSIPEIVPIGTEIAHGPIKLLYIKPGTLRYGLNIADSRPMILGPGMHYFNDQNIVINQNIINLKTNTKNCVFSIDNDYIFNFIIVKKGFNGIINKNNGELEILSHGIHFCESPDNFKSFVSIQEESLKFNSITLNKHKFLTMDNIELSIDAILLYKVIDVNKVFTKNIKNNYDLNDILLTEARTLLITLIRSENFSNFGKKDKNINLDKNNSSTIDLETTQQTNDINNNLLVFDNIVEFNDVSIDFQSNIKNIEYQFKQIMQENFGNSHGFDIQSLKIENIKLMFNIPYKWFSNK